MTKRVPVLRQPLSRIYLISHKTVSPSTIFCTSSMSIALPQAQWSITTPSSMGQLSAPPVEKSVPSEKSSFDSIPTLSSSRDQGSYAAQSASGR